MTIAAFVAAALSLLVAALSLGWQIASWSLDGRRVRVVLIHGAVGLSGMATGKVGRDRQPKDLDSLRAEGFTDAEVVGISVTNVGRAPVRIDRYGVRLKKGGFAYYPIGDAIGPELPFRLAPGETESWLADAADARRLVTTTRKVGRSSSSDVVMEIVLGTGDVKRTRRSLLVV